MTSPNKWNIRGKILKSNKNFIRSFIAILFELEKNVFFKIAFRPQINVHLVRLDFRNRGKFVSGILETV